VTPGCLLSPTSFNVYLEYIITEAFDGFEGGSKYWRYITNLRFADDIYLVAGKAKELVNLTRRLEESVNTFGMQISAGKSDNDENQ